MAEDAGSADGGPDLRPPDEDLDPAVRFLWAETLPGQGVCGPGRFTGSFTCTMVRSGMESAVGGLLRFELTGASEGELSIANGTMSDITGAVFSAGLEGTLDCVSHSLGAVSVNGMSIDIVPLFPTFRTFEAALQGELDEQTLTLLGTFSMTNDAGDVCRGSFEAGAAP